MKPRLQLFLLCAPLLVAGCYTQLRGPAEHGLEPTSDYWAEPYYELAYYPAPWEVYPGSRWWYADYWPCYYESHSYVPVDDDEARHAWDRGPGAYVPSVGGHGIGGGGGGRGGGSVPSPGPIVDPSTPTPTSPPEPPETRDTDKKDAPPSDKRPEKPTERKGWGR